MFVGIAVVVTAAVGTAAASRSLYLFLVVYIALCIYCTIALLIQYLPSRHKLLFSVARFMD